MITIFPFPSLHGLPCRALPHTSETRCALLGMTRLPDKMFQAWQAVTGPPAG